LQVRIVTGSHTGHEGATSGGPKEVSGEASSRRSVARGGVERTLVAVEAAAEPSHEGSAKPKDGTVDGG